jgi:hypothetical protein
MIGSHYSVRFVQTRREEPRITFEEFRDVKWACHHWLMENSPEYRREQLELPERKQMRKRNECDNSLIVSDEEKD